MRHWCRLAGMLGLALSFSLLAAAPPSKASGPEPTPDETLLLELINRFRADPMAEAQRIVANAGTMRLGAFDADGFLKEMNEFKPVPPLVFNLQLLEAARKHSAYHISHNGAAHGEDPGQPGFTGASPDERCKKAGYTGGYVGENAFRNANSLYESLGCLVVDNGIPSRGHRRNLANGGAREVGPGIAPWDRGPTISVTHDFGNSGAPRLAGGVIYYDRNNNSFYDIGESAGSVKISASDGSSGASWASGAFTLELKSADKITLTAELDGKRYSQTFEAGQGNLKFDWIVPPKEALDRADKLIADVERAKDPSSAAYGNALIALHLGAARICLDAQRRARIDELTQTVKADLATHQNAVLEALRSDFDAFSKTLAEHRKPYSSTPAASWFAEMESAGRQKQSVAGFVKNAGLLKPNASVKKQFIQQLQTARQLLVHAEPRQALDAAIAEAGAVETGK